MKFKINTKEKFKEIQLLESSLSANMTGNLIEMLYDVIKTEPRNLILSLKDVNKMDLELADALTGIQTRYYDDGVSFVLCEMSSEIEDMLEEAGILETMNIAPTLSEAWDIVQMEEIERELLKDWE
jgi:anti-anti-sigma factor